MTAIRPPCGTVLKAEEKSKQAIASIIISALTAGVSGATISFE